MGYLKCPLPSLSKFSNLSIPVKSMTKRIPFRVQSHVLKLLGDELIGHDRLAVFELVKNGYDADATEIEVVLDLESASPTISVRDNGSGMSIDTIEHGWLEIGTDFKRGEKHGQRTKAFGRMSLGEKGVGRLALQKLGDKLRVVTRTIDGPEYEFTIDWNELINESKFIDGGVAVDVTRNRVPKVFAKSSGTFIEVSDLHRADWTSREIRDLYRLVTSLSNPFDEVESFSVSLILPGREGEVEDLPDVKDMLDTATWYFDFLLAEDGKLTWKYKFTPPRFKGLVTRGTKGKDKLELIPPDDEDQSHEERRNDDQIFLNRSQMNGIGPISGHIYGFHRRSEILKESGSLSQIKAWLDSQTGVRVYRDRVRVFNYGEPGDDWLGLNARRINRPAGKLGTHSVIAHIGLDLAKSQSLREKTNREGFDENKAFRGLKRIALSVFDKFEREHATDRASIETALKGDQSVPGVKQALDKLQAIAKTHKLEKEIKPLVQSIQQELDTFRELMLASGMAGINLALVFHEVVHVIDRIRRLLDSNVGQATVRLEVDHLRKLLDTFKPLLQRERVRKFTAGELVERAANIHQDRFKRHNITFSNWIAEGKMGENFTVTGPAGLLVGAISNVIDNAIYWTRFRRERDGVTTKAAIVVLSSWDEASGGFVAVVDSGPGFQLPRDQVGIPFRSTRAGGMGLGLYYCKLVMESLGGKFEAVDASDLRDEIKIPKAFDGAAVVFHFKDAK